MSTFIASHFFNPAFVLPGVALVSSPIIIHLINRMRFRRVRFAAMEFLLQSQKRNRRRLLIEQLLLLLLRILIILGLTALIARLILDESQLSMFRSARTHHFVLLDDSGSMRDRWGETTAFDEALGVVRRLAAEAAR
ncbi:MAG: BatA domain-containing protein, partial [Planctomycetaceae bacterium]|nr:BatA domain-containing protein [Planctomycetaceae bacterium]